MHELGIVFHIIDTVEQVGRENGVTQVRCVTLDVGQVSGIEDPYLMDCWPGRRIDRRCCEAPGCRLSRCLPSPCATPAARPMILCPRGAPAPIVAARTPTCCKAMRAVFEKLRRDRECTS